jgi:WD40 repeat protein/predicted Ser/Thr protein kinase
MTPERDSHEKRIFCAACRLPPEDWDSFVEEQCSGDTGLKEGILALLRARQRRLESRGESSVTGAGHVDSGLEATRAFSPRLDDALLGRTIGRYRVNRRLGQGGMGRVYEAVDQESGRRVALKVLRGAFTPSAVERFEREAEILWKLSHPAIARIHDARAERLDGEEVPVIAMELIPGARNLLEYAAEEELTVAERLDLFVSACDGVHIAHQAQVLHRDLKPDNILVAPSGQPKVIDFGIARLLESEDTAARGLTRTGQLIGTLPYMSPEQCDALPGRLDIRSDVYSLGVVLYELVTGKMPYSITGISTTEVLRTIRSVPPVRPSRHDASLRGDLETVLLTALEKDRELRYPTAVALADDIRRFRRGETVHARPPSVRRLVQAFYRAHRKAVVVAAVLLAVFLGGAVFSFFLGVRATFEEARSRLRLSAARDILTSLGDLERQEVARARSVLGRVKAAARGWEWEHVRGRLDQSVGGGPTASRECAAAFVADGIAVVACESAKRDGLALYLLAADEMKEFRVEALPDESSTQLRNFHPLALTADGRLLAAGRPDGSVSFWNVDWVEVAARWLRSLPSPPERAAGLENYSALAFSSDAGLLAAGCPGGCIHVYDLRSGRVASAVAHHGDVVSSLAFDTAGTRLASASWDYTAAVWSVGRNVEGPLHCLARLRGHSYHVTSVSFAPDGRWVATGFLDETIRIWDVEQSIDFQERDAEFSGLLVETLVGHKAGVRALAFDPQLRGGRTRLVSGSFDRTVRLWELDDAAPAWQVGDPTIRRTRRCEEFSRFRGHVGPVRAVSVSPDGRWALSSGDSGAGGEVKLWPLGVVEDVPMLRGHTSSVRSVDFASIGRESAARTILVSAGDRTVTVWDPEACRGLLRLRAQPEGVVSSVAALGGESSCRIAAGMVGVGIRIWEVEVEPVARALSFMELLCPEGGMPRSVVFSEDGRRLGAGFEDGAARVWRRGPGDAWALEHTLRGHATAVRVVGFLGGGRHLVSANGRDAEDARSGEWELRIWDLGPGRAVARRALDDAAQSMAFDVERGFVAVGYANGKIGLWDVSRPTRPVFLRALEGHTGSVAGLSFQPQLPPGHGAGGVARRLASGAMDAEVKVWNVEAGIEVLTLHQVGKVLDVCFSPDGSVLASGSEGFEGSDNVVRLWETGVSPSVRRDRAWRRAVEREAYLALRGLLDAGEGKITPALVRQTFELLDPSGESIDASALDVLALRSSRDGALILRETLSAVSSDGDLPRSVVERALRWAQLAAERYPESAELRDLEAELRRRTSTGR